MNDGRENKGLTPAGVTVLVLIGVMLLAAPVILFVLPRLTTSRMTPAVPAPPSWAPTVSHSLKRSGKDVLMTLTFDNSRSSSEITSVTFRDLLLNKTSPASMPSFGAIPAYSKKTVTALFPGIKAGTGTIQVSLDYTMPMGGGSSADGGTVTIP